MPEAAADDAGLARSQEWDTLRRALGQLPPRQRAVLVLRYLEDMPDAAIAAAVAVPLALSGAAVPRTPGTVQPTPAIVGRASATPSGQSLPVHVVMPAVTGLGLKAAKAVIQAAVPQPDIIVRYVKTSAPAGIVIAQIPAPGARVSRDGRVTLKVSSAR